MKGPNDKFEWFDASDPNPLGKYKQPKPNTSSMPKGTGYPQTDINKDGIMVKGRWPAGTPMKKHIDMNGYGAATKGRQFLAEDRDPGE